jgi:hypothetical protein
MKRTRTRRDPAAVGRRPVLLVEGDRPDLTPLAARRVVAAGFDLVWCSGPADVRDECPLVMDGRCPVGRPDVVVCALDGEWRAPVEAAWRLDRVPVVTAAMGQHVDYAGAALRALHGRTAEG